MHDFLNIHKDKSDSDICPHDVKLKKTFWEIDRISNKKTYSSHSNVVSLWSFINILNEKSTRNIK